jgi:hypothetical protein
MATINYAREWQRLCTRLKWSITQMTNELELAQTDEDRRLIQAALTRAQEQLASASAELERHTYKRDSQL